MSGLAQPQSPHDITVLVVDDERDNTEMYRRALHGYRVLQATRGDQALSLVAEHGVDIIVTDQLMPGMTGAQLLERVRAVNPIARRVIVSAHCNAESLLEAINCGEVERYMLKPVRPDVLRETIDELAGEYARMMAERARVAELEDQLSRLQQQLHQVHASPDGWERLELEIIRAGRYKRPLSLIVVENGMPLRAQIATAVREVDLVVPVGARLVLALPETDAAGAESMRGRLRKSHPGTTFLLASFPTDGEDVTGLLAAAR
jgi:YesN/AraC family two-component response regulator